jgi:predicted amidohydrolase YtcJ
VRGEGNGGWLRGVGYHASVAGEIDRDWLDAVVPHRPLRIQHRSGQLWILNSRALARLGVADGGGDDPFERSGGRLTGRLYGADAWLRQRLGAALPDLAAASLALARRGVTGVTDASPGNGLQEFEHFAAEQARGQLRQKRAGDGRCAARRCGAARRLAVGPTKLYLREIALPPFDELCDDIRRSHAAGRALAVHCVTLAELVLAVQALRECGAHDGDRIEHASLCSPQAVELLRSARLRVVTQPHFVFERGDAYRADLPAEELGWLYRGRSLVDAGIALAAGSDAPYGDADPWASMAAAVRRRSRGGQSIGAGEALSPLQALGLFGGDPLRPGQGMAALTVGARADLCVTDRPWREMLNELGAVQVRLTLRQGEPIWSA